MPINIFMGDDGILGIHFSGRLDSHDAFAFEKDVAVYLEAASPEYPIATLVSSLPNTSFEFEMRKAFTAFCQDDRIQKAGIINSSPSLRVISIFLSQLNGNDHVHLFDEESLARQWLNHSAAA